MSKGIRLNYLCALIILLAFSLLFVRRAMLVYEENFIQIKKNIETYYAKPPKEAIFKRLYWDFMKITNRKNINGVVIMNDGRLDLDIYNSILLPERADHIVEFNNYLKNKNTPFLFLRAPNFMKDTSQLPKGYENTVIEDTARFMATLKENGVDTFDFREEMNNEKMDFATAFFMGDHHWTAETAFWAYGKAGAFINSKYGFHLDEKTWNPDEYEFIKYDKAFLGSAALKIGDLRLKEDITAIIPKYPTQYEISNKLPQKDNDDIKASTSGSFTDVFIPTVKIENDNTFEYSSLNAFRVGFWQYKNSKASENKKVLLIADSFAIPFVTYLSTAIENVDYLYLENETNYKVYQALETDKYDLVMFLVYDGIISNSNDDDITKDRMYLGKVPKQ